MIALNIKKPERCKDCPILYETEGAYADYCRMFDFNGKGWLNGEVARENISKKKPEWCPLINLDIDTKEKYEFDEAKRLHSFKGLCDVLK